MTPEELAELALSRRSEKRSAIDAAQLPLWGLGGAALGAGIGALSPYATEDNEDDIKKKIGRRALIGALAGGAGGLAMPYAGEGIAALVDKLGQTGEKTEHLADKSGPVLPGDPQTKDPNAPGWLSRFWASPTKRTAATFSVTQVLSSLLQKRLAILEHLGTGGSGGSVDQAIANGMTRAIPSINTAPTIARIKGFANNPGMMPVRTGLERELAEGMEWSRQVTPRVKSVAGSTIAAAQGAAKETASKASRWNFLWGRRLANAGVRAKGAASGLRVFPLLSAALAYYLGPRNQGLAEETGRQADLRQEAQAAGGQ